MKKILICISIILLYSCSSNNNEIENKVDRKEYNEKIDIIEKSSIDNNVNNSNYGESTVEGGVKKYNNSNDLNEEL